MAYFSEVTLVLLSPEKRSLCRLRVKLCSSAALMVMFRGPATKGSKVGNPIEGIPREIQLL